METSYESPNNIENKITHKDRAKLILKFLLVGVVFWLLFRKGLVTTESFKKIFAAPLVLAMTLSIMIINTLLGAYRWMVLLRAQKIYLTFTQTLRYNLIGIFFNIALPGAISGDVVKAVYIAKRFPLQRAHIAGSVLMDRTLGFSALILVAVISGTYSRFVDWGGQLPNSLIYTVVALGSIVVLMGLYFIFMHRRDPVMLIFKRLSKWNSKLSSLERTYASMIHYRKYSRETTIATITSFVIHFFLVSMVFLLAEVLSDVTLSFVALAVVVPIGMLATMIPILPAGVGTGHAAFYGLFQLVGSNQGAEVFSWMVIFQVFFGAIGGVLYLRTKYHQH